MAQKTPGAYGPGEFSIAVLLIFYMVNGKVFSEISEYIGDDDRRGKATAHFCHFRLRQGACARAGKNSIILFGHKVRLFEKIQPLQMTRASEIIAPQNCREELPEG